MKKVVAILLVLCLTLGICSQVYAVENAECISEDILGACMDILCADDMRFDISQEQLSLLYVGEPIKSYVYSSAGVLIENSYEIYPFFSNSEIMFLALVHEDGRVELTQMMTQELSCFVGDKIAVVYDSEKCSVWNKSKNETEPIIIYPNSIEDRGVWNGADDVSIIESVKLEAKQKVDGEATGGIQLYGSIQPNVILSVPVVRQKYGTYYNLCWAACISSIGKHLTGNSISIEKIAEDTYEEDDFDYSLDPRSVPSIMREHYNVSYTFKELSPDSVIAYSTIYTNLENGYPIYSCWHYQNISGHAMVIRGINTTSMTLYLMDPMCGNATASRVNGVYRYTSVADSCTYQLDNYYVSRM